MTTVLKTPHDPRASRYPYLVKTIRSRNNQDFWNIFMAGATRFNDPAGHPNPLAYLRIRATPRPATTRRIYSLQYTPPTHAGEEPKYSEWVVRELIDTPDERLRALKPVSHERPMYEPEMKAPYSSITATTYVKLASNVRPRLFGREDEPACGVFFPLKVEYVLLNRIFASDAATVVRHHDREPFTHENRLTREELDTNEDLKGPEAAYTEVLGRLRIYNPDVGDSSDLEYIKPGLLLCANSNPNIFLYAVLLTLKRAFDLMFCLKRKFPATYRAEPVPILVYDYNADPPANCFYGPLFFKGDENIFDIICKYFGRPVKIDRRDPTFNRWYGEIILQQGLWRAVNRADTERLVSTEDFNSFLKTPPPPYTDSKRPVFYIETLRAFVEFFAGRPEVPTFHEYYRNLIAEFTAGTPRDNTLKFEQAGFDADLGNSSYPTEPKIHPLHSFEFDVNYVIDGKLPLVQAVQHNNRVEFDKILENPIVQVNKRQPDKKNGPALNLAIRLGRNDMVRTLLERADIDVNTTSNPGTRSFSALQIAIEVGSDEIFDLLLTKPTIDINLADEDGITPLMRAAHMMRERMFAAMIERPDVDMNKISKYGNNILMLIMRYCSHEDVVHRMLQRVITDPRLNINTTHNGETALIFIAKGKARWLRDEEINALLARPDLDVNLKVNGTPALIHAAADFPDLVRKILDVYGCDKTHLIGEDRFILIDATNIDGQTAFDLGKREVKMMILKYKGINAIPLSPWEETFLKNDIKPNCEICGRTTYILSRHHCRRCMKFICSNCSCKKYEKTFCADCAGILAERQYK